MKAPIIFIAAMAVLSACSIKQGKTEQISAIDSTLQTKATSILESKMEEFDKVIVMEGQTGHIKASIGADSIIRQKSGLVRTVSLLAALETGKVKLSDTILGTK